MELPANLKITVNEKRRPTLILVITNDQGYGDLGCHGKRIGNFRASFFACGQAAARSTTIIEFRPVEPDRIEFSIRFNFGEIPSEGPLAPER